MNSSSPQYYPIRQTSLHALTSQHLANFLPPRSKVIDCPPSTINDQPTNERRKIHDHQQGATETTAVDCAYLVRRFTSKARELPRTTYENSTRNRGGVLDGASFRQGLGLQLPALLVELLEAGHDAEVDLALWTVVLRLPPQYPAVGVYGVPTVIAAERRARS